MKKLIHLSMLVLIVLQSFSPAIDALARESALESASLPGLAVEQEESTAIPTATGTPTPTPTPTDEFEPTPTGTPEPPTPDVSTGSTTDSATPELTPTLTEEPVEEETQNLGEYQILLTANPEFITPGGRVNLEWQVSGEGLEDLDLVFILPYGAVLKSDKKSDMPESVYRTPAAEEKGGLQLDISREAEMPVLIQAFLLPQDAGEDFYAGPAPLAGAHIALIEKVNVNKRGGKIAGLNGKVKVDFSDGALTENVEVFIHRPLPESMPPHSLSGQPFEIKARSAKDGKGISTFGDEVRIEVDYSYLGLDEAYAADLALYWYNEDSQEWEILPSYANTETKTLHASTTHFTVFDIDVHNWQSSRLPTLDNFQVSNFTGAGTFSLPIEVPPGPGGLQPGLTLSYNSQVVDQSLSTSQASWVGMGWSLDTGMIERNTRGTTSDKRDDTFSLTLNGVSSMIVKDSNGYHLADENFWKIEKLSTPDSWVVWDKVGNTYYFEYTAVAKYSTECGSLGEINYQWHLARIKNIHGKEISYTYQKETKVFKYDVWSNYYQKCRTTGESLTDTAVYPHTIVYPHGRYRVRFELADRNDYKATWAISGAHENFMRKRLANIYVEQDADGNGSFETIIRRYEFVYADNTNSNLVWPGVTWSAGGKTSTLVAVSEYGLGNLQTLPAHTFTYGDQMHLTRAENGYGGAVEFEYDAWIYDGRAAKSYMILDRVGKAADIEQGVPTGSCRNLAGSWYTGIQGQGWEECKVSKNGTQFWMDFSGKIVTNTSENKIFVRPGGYYRMTAVASSANGNTITTGLWDGVEQRWEPDVDTNVFKLPVNKNKVEMLISAVGGSYATLGWAKLELLPIVNRVTEKRIYDGRGNQYSFTYAYEGATVNHSGLVEPTAYCPLQTNEPNYSWGYKVDTNCHEFTEVNSQFRGHSQVTETGPNGLKTITRYHQDDVLKGRPISVTVTTGNLTSGLLSQQLYTYESDTYGVAKPVKVGNCTNCPPYIGLFGAWVRTTAQENWVYASDGSHSATRVEYTYEGTYGNQVVAENKVRNGSNWVAHIRTETDYFPNVNGVYLVGLPARTRQLDAGGNELGNTLFLYDGNLGGFPAAPTQGVLTAVRSQNTGFSQVSYTYDGWGNQISQKMWSTYGTDSQSPSGGGRTTTTQFDPLYRTYPISSTNPLNQTVTWTYNYSLGVPLSETDPNGAVTSAAYDVFGRMTKLIRPGDDSDDPSIKIDYFDTASPFRIEISQRVVASHYLTLRRYYDGMGRQFKTESGNTISGSFSLFNTTQTLFDSPTVTRQSLPFGPNETPVYSTSETRYENGKKISSVLSPDGSLSKSVVDGLTTTVTDPALRETTSLADAWGRTVSVTPPDGPAVNYTYDVLGRLLTATRGGATTKIKYDMAGRKIGMDDPDMGTAGTLDDDNWGWTYTYDALGNLTGQTDARGCTLTLTYDLLNRLTAKNSSGAGCGTQVSSAYTYDAGPNGKGRRTGMSDASTGSGSTTWAYDARGRVTIENKRIGSQIYTTQWTYNSADLPVTMTYPDGEVVTNTYNSQMMLESVFGDSTYVFDTNYDFAGRLTQRRLGGELSLVKNQEMTRANIASDILRAKYGLNYQPPTPASQRFGDVPPSHPEYKWIDKLAVDGITAGCGSGNYCPETSLIRISMMIFLLRAKYGGDYTPPPVPEDGHIFADMVGSSTEAWAVDAYNKGISNGCGGGNFCPSTVVSRDMAAALIENTFDLAISPVIEQSYQYYAWDQQGGRLQSLAATGLQSLSYQYDQVGNITQIQDSIATETQTFGYDALDRLTGWTLVETTRTTQETYTYDLATGNLASKAGIALFYSDTDHAHATTAMGDNTYIYDANGNQITRNIANDGQNNEQYELLYDAENRLVKVKKDSATIAEFVFDGDGKRVISQENGQTTYFLGSVEIQDPAQGTPPAPPTPTPTVSPTPLPIDFSPMPFKDVRSWEFSTTVDGWGWQSSHVSGLGWQSGGYVGANITGNDPYFLSADNLSVSMTDNKIIKIRMRNYTNSTTGQLFFITTTDWAWNQAKSKTFTIQPNSGFTEYTIDMSTVAGWTGTLKRLRLDPADSTGSFVVDYIRIGVDPNWKFDSAVEGWGEPSAHVSNFGWQSGGYIGGNITGIDPSILSPNNLGLDISTEKYVKVRFKNATGSTSAQLFFTTNASQAFSEGKSKVFPIIPNSDYTEYVIDMSALPSWTGTLKQLRFDPGSSTGSFSIDFVQLGRAFVAPPPPESTPHPERFYVEQGGSVAIEAENYTGRVSGTGNAAGHIWQEVNVTGGYLGSGAMQALPNTGVNTNLQINGPALTYRIYFQTPGTYYVYLRGYGGGSDDSVHVGINGTAVTTNAGSGLDGFGYASFNWRNLYNGVPTQVNIPAAGMYTFYVWMREDGTLIDRIWLSKTAGAIANGSTVAGPAESVLSFPGSTLTPSPVNVAAYKPAVADSWCNSSTPASKAVNNTWTNDINDKWCSKGVSKWLQVDLGDVYPITSFDLYHAGAGGEDSSLNTKAFNISVSIDGANWSEVVNVSNNSANISTHQISPQNARYVRLVVSQGEQSSNINARIFQLMVFANLPLPSTPPESPTNTPTPSPAPSGTAGSVAYNGTWTKYYFAGASRVAMRTCTGTTCEAPTFLLGDHLGSTSLTTDASGVKTSEMRYAPWGETRYTWTKDMAPGLPSRYTFTGQYSYMDDPTTTAREGFGLMFYNARWYDVQLGRFAQADIIIPEQSQGTQAWDRYAYVNNNPLKYTDPSGNCVVGGHDVPDSSPACKGYADPVGNTEYITNGTRRIYRQELGGFKMKPITSASSYSNAAEQGYSGYAGSGAPDIDVTVALKYKPNSKQVATGAGYGAVAPVLVDVAQTIINPIVYSFLPDSQAATLYYTEPSDYGFSELYELTVTNNLPGYTVDYQVTVTGYVPSFNMTESPTINITNVSVGPGSTEKVYLGISRRLFRAVQIRILARTSCGGDCWLVGNGQFDFVPGP
jgi:RHS repeat-associated protein